MSKENGNESAFTVAASYDDEHPEILTPQGGLTKRELITAMAMHGLLAGCKNFTPDIAHISKQAVLHADALLTQLDPPTGK